MRIVFLLGRKEMRQRGFTLIEVVLTLTILVMLLVVILSALRLGIRSWEKGESAIEGASAKRYMATRLERDIGSAYPYIRKDGEAAKLLFNGTENTLGFVTASQRYADSLPWGGTRWVYYYAGEGGFTVAEKTVPALDIEKKDGGNLTVLSPDIKEVRFEYMGPDGWEESWNADDKKMLPSDVRSSVTFKDGRAPLTLTVHIGVTQPENVN